MSHLPPYLGERRLGLIWYGKDRRIRAAALSARLKALGTLYWSLVGTTLLAAAIVCGTFWLAARGQRQDEWIRHTLAVRNDIVRINSQLQRAESGERGYLLTGQDGYLDGYHQAVGLLPATIEETIRLVADNPSQKRVAGHVADLVARRLDELRTTISERQAGHADAALSLFENDDDRSTEAIRLLLADMYVEENRLLELRQASAARFALLLRIGGGAALALICVIGVLVGHFTRRAFLELEATRNALVVKHRELVEQIGRRQSAEDELRQAQKMEALGQLTGGIAHDFNNMLAVIIGSVEIVQQRLRKGDYAVERFLQSANKAAERAVALTSHLLAFARRQPLSPEPIDSNKMIADMSYLLRSTLGETIHIETIPAADLWPATADAHQLENAILNVAINARDAMPDGGKLTIETANIQLDAGYCRHHAEVEPGDYVMIAISDTGAGMTAEVAARVFDPFFTTKPLGKGTGLGLSQVYGFLKQSHGHVAIYSEVGAGTTVKLYLPRLAGNRSTSGRRPPRPAKRPGSGELVLVVEDDQLVRDQTIAAMRELGYAVLDSANAADALAILERMPKVRLLFTDVVMPEVNGKQLADEALRRRPDLKVLFTTGYTANAVVHGGVLDPGVNLISKPFTLDELADKVRAALDA